MRKEREVLKHESDAALIDVRASDVPAGQEYLSGVRDFEPGDRAQQRGLARSARSQKRNVLTGLDGECDVAQSHVTTEPLCQTFQSQNGFCGQYRHALPDSRGVNPRRRRMSLSSWFGAVRAKE